MAVVAVAFPLGSARASSCEAVSEVVADDVACLIARMFVVSHVFARAEVRYQHNQRTTMHRRRPYCHIIGIINVNKK